MTRPSSNTDQKLLLAARDLLPKTGLSNLSIRMVCKKAGVNLGMFNYHFKTRDAFVEKLLIDAYEEFFSKFTIDVKSGATPLEQLKNAVYSIAMFVRDNRHLIAMIIEDVIRGNEKIIEFARKNMTKHAVVIIKLIRQCQKEGYIVKIPIFNLLPLMAAAIVGPNLIVRLVERHVAKDIKLKILVKMISTQILSEKAIKQRLDIVFKGLTLGGAL
jgi:AcrR family transcriptional regulator